MIENPFDAPIPGQSLTDTPGNAKWEHPPQFSNVEDAAEYIWDRLHEKEILSQVIAFLKEGIPVEALVRMILFGGFVEGKWNPDIAILIAGVVYNQIMAIGVKAEVKNIKLFLTDKSNNKFHNQFAKFKVQKEKGITESTEENKAEKFVEEVKAELEAQEPSGLMTKETE